MIGGKQTLEKYKIELNTRAVIKENLSILNLIIYISPCHSLTSSQPTLSPPRVLKSILYVCVFIPVLPLGSSEQIGRAHV